VAQLSTLGHSTILTFFTFVPIALVIVWLVAEFRGRTRVRVVAGLAALVFVAVVAFLWGGFANAVSHMDFPEPHDSKADAAFMDAATNTSGTNSLSR
jgi:NADH:ubiquinone oxidoreductase subunit 6 (subunit J)